MNERANTRNGYLNGLSMYVVTSCLRLVTVWVAVQQIAKWKHNWNVRSGQDGVSRVSRLKSTGLLMEGVNDTSALCRLNKNPPPPHKPHL